jgi:hypothetical protein
MRQDRPTGASSSVHESVPSDEDRRRAPESGTDRVLHCLDPVVCDGGVAEPGLAERVVDPLVSQPPVRAALEVPDHDVPHTTSVNLPAQGKVKT